MNSQIVRHYTDEAVEVLKKLIAIPSVSREEAKAADFIESYATE